ncbi:unnamed protein product, partial [Allacma fusca]
MSITQEQIAKHFPGNKKIRIRKYKDQNTASIHFNSQKDTLSSFEKSTLAHREFLQLDWTLPN